MTTLAILAATERRLSQATDMITDLRSKVAALESALAQAHAEAAAMREHYAIDADGFCACCAQSITSGDPHSAGCVYADATSAGAKLLDRLAKAEAVCEEARHLYDVYEHLPRRAGTWERLFSASIAYDASKGAKGGGTCR